MGVGGIKLFSGKSDQYQKMSRRESGHYQYSAGQFKSLFNSPMYTGCTQAKLVHTECRKHVKTSFNYI